MSPPGPHSLKLLKAVAKSIGVISPPFSPMLNSFKYKMNISLTSNIYNTMQVSTIAMIDLCINIYSEYLWKVGKSEPLV